MEYLRNFAQCFGIPVRTDGDTTLLRVHSWENDNQKTDGVYLRFSSFGEYYSVMAEAHIHNYLDEQDVTVQDRFYPHICHPITEHLAYQYCLNEEAFQTPIVGIKNFFDGCKHIQCIDERYVFSTLDDMEGLTVWAMDKSKYVTTQDDYLYVSIPNSIEMSIIMQTAEFLSSEDIEYMVTNRPNYNENSYAILRFFLEASIYRPSRYITVNKTGPNLFELTAYKSGYCSDTKERHFLISYSKRKSLRTCCELKMNPSLFLHSS